MRITIKPSTRKNKKWMAVIEAMDGTHFVHFGATGYDDFTIHKDATRRERYIGRHRPQEARFWKITRLNMLRPAFWARWLLWNRPSLRESAKDIVQRAPFGLEIVID